MDLDPVDLQIVGLLAIDGRMTFADLGQRVGLTGPSVAERVRRLEAQGVIRDVVARLDPAALGLGLTAFVAVSLTGAADTIAFLAAVDDVPEIVECHHTSGQDDYLLKVHVDGTRGLEHLITHGLKSIPGVSTTRTTIVLSSPCERVVLPPA